MFNLVKKSSYQTLNLIQISKNALLSNFHFFQQLNPKSYLCPVLKSNAYGHGLKLVGKFVDQEISPEFICVDSLFEAYELEKSGITTKILIMGYTFPANFKFRKINFHLPVFDLPTLEVLNKTQPGINVHLKIDTGMNRLGIKENEVEIFMRALKKFNRINVVGIYSHLSSADEIEETDFTNKQIETFKKITSYFENNGFNFKYKHIMATAGAFRFCESEFNLIRLGLGFYGISPFPNDSLFDKKLREKIKPTLKLLTHIAELKEVSKGETVSYNRTFRATRPMKIAILPLGYYDGIDRRLSNLGQVKITNTFCPILGQVCMNITMVDVSGVKRPFVGQEATVYDNLVNSINSVKNTANLIQSIPYEVLANLSETTKRILV